MSEYYVFYDNEKNIVAIGNDISSSTSNNYFKINKALADDFAQGKKNMSDYFVKHNHLNIYSLGKKLDIDSAGVFKDLTTLKILNEDVDLTIKHSSEENCWYITLSDEIKASIDVSQYNKILKFYVVNHNNYNYIFNIIELTVQELISDNSKVIFKSEKEKDITKLAIVTKKYFDKIGIKL